MIYPEQRKYRGAGNSRSYIFYKRVGAASPKVFACVTVGVMPKKKVKNSKSLTRERTIGGKQRRQRTKENANKPWIKCCYVHYMNNPKGIQSLRVCVYLCI